MTRYRSWGMTPDTAQHAASIHWRNELSALTKFSKCLPFGNGRSYGDSCLNSDGTLLDTQHLNHFISFDTKTGLLRCESGVLFAEILKLIVPHGWFLPVTPGTKFITVGGAIANDVHGKNHHHEGTFGQHVRCFELARSDGNTFLCSMNSHSDLFEATIGGLGLTGLITWAEIQLIPISSDQINVKTTPFKGIDEFMVLSKQSSETDQYSVAWIDCASSGKQLGRGSFIAGNHAVKAKGKPITSNTLLQRKKSIPFNFPKYTLNKYSIQAFNSLYFKSQVRASRKSKLEHYDSYFYPLDGINNWNRIYGKSGFYQYQFVLPSDRRSAMIDALKLIVESKMGSFLAVLKEFGEIKSPGMLSFPRPGICLALDFSNRGQRTTKLLSQLDNIVMANGGSVYPAKDRNMSAKAFAQYYPEAKKFQQFIDPKFTSDFWERVKNA